MTRARRYDLEDYDAMLADPLRTPAYLAAIAAVVRPGDVVVEIGAGTGYFSVAAARAGARKVYAIEMSPVVEVAREIIAENGCADQVEVIRGDATTVELPEKGTVLLFDLRGWFPMHNDSIRVITSVRDRLMAPGGRIISRRDTLYAAPCAAPEGWSAVELKLGAEAFGIRRSSMARLARSLLYREREPSSSHFAPAVVAHTIDYATVTSPDVDARLEWTIARDGDVHGVILWFTSELADGIVFATGPDAPPNVYGQPFLPFERPLAARAGDRLEVRLQLRLYDSQYVYVWETRFTPVSGATPVEMRQSTFPVMLAHGGPSAS